MATTVTNRVWRQSTPDTVDKDLADVWREIGEQGPVARSVMSNLVVFRFTERRSADRRDPSDLRDPRDPSDLPDDLLREVVARHPSRTIIVEQNRGRHDEPGRPVDARVGVSVFGPATAPYAVEWVVLRSACAEASWPSVVRRFARGDVPTSIWWTDDLSNAPTLDAIVSTGRQLLYDSRRWRDIARAAGVLSTLLDKYRVDLADINWRRLAPLRLALAQASKTPSTQRTGSLSVHIAHRRDELALASLLGGWLAARLNCNANSWPTLAEEDLGPELLRIDLAHPGRRITARLSDERAQVEQSGMAPLVIAASHEDPAESIAVELRSLSMDQALREAVLAIAHRPASRH
ncbi:MAG TPA: glucose-6-phosphate dehydrogenase assembly protein OpcA [Vicinamibacterales bacterium]